MEKLTELDELGTPHLKQGAEFMVVKDRKGYLKDVYGTHVNKLCKLEDLEEELGCPIDVIIKAIKNGIWFTNEDDKLEYIDEALCFNTKIDSGKFIFDNSFYYCKNVDKSKGREIYLEDYKKTWWLREDKSE